MNKLTKSTRLLGCCNEHVKCIVVPSMSDRNVIFCLQLLSCVRFISMHIFSASGNRESRSGSCLSTVNELGSYRSSLIWVHTICHRGFLNISVDEQSRQLLLRLAH